MVDAAPGHVCHMQQAVDAAEVAERPVVGDVLDEAVDDLETALDLGRLAQGTGFVQPSSALEGVAARHLESLGIQKQHVVFSDYTSEEMWMEGGKYGSIDPCYPSKVGQAHIHNLLFHHHNDEKPLHFILNPVQTHIPSFLKNTQDQTSCPIVQGAPGS